MRASPSLRTNSAILRPTCCSAQKPGHYEVVRKLLAHKSLATTYEHYAGAETTAAIELYDEVILGLKRGATGASAVAPPPSEPLDPLNPFLIDGGRR